MERKYGQRRSGSIGQTYVISVVAANVAEFVTYPLDLIKTRLQVQGESGKTKIDGSKIKYRGMIKTGYGIASEEGLFKLWQGVPPALYRHVIYTGVRIVAYDILKNNFSNTNDPSFPLWKAALCGISAGAFAQWLANPTDLVKVQLQMEGKRRLMGLQPRVHSVGHAFTVILNRGGVKGLWKGSLPNVQRAALVNLGDLTTYDTVKHFLMRNTNLTDCTAVHIMSSLCAGLVSAIFGQPADVIKTRVMHQQIDKHGRGLLYNGSIDCLTKTVQKEGIAALYKGFLPCWIRMAPWSLIFWLSFENIHSLIGAKNQ